MSCCSRAAENFSVGAAISNYLLGTSKHFCSTTACIFCSHQQWDSFESEICNTTFFYSSWHRQMSPWLKMHWQEDECSRFLFLRLHDAILTSRHEQGVEEMIYSVNLPINNNKKTPKNAHSCRAGEGRTHKRPSYRALFSILKSQVHTKTRCPSAFRLRPPTYTRAST